ncbi:hypothetical protein C0989_010814 [Termitomyces sp. Mn162]|nr:hypothetical protein C0989_010814 [Termitomyces sp. Mn162]
MKLACVLMTTVVTSKRPKLESEAKNAVLVVAFLLEDNITDKVLETLANTVASKILEHIEPVAHHIAKSIDPISVNNTTRAKTTLTLKSVSGQLKAVSSSLHNIVTRLAASPTPTGSLLPAPCPTWANIASAGKPPQIPSKFNLPPPPNTLASSRDYYMMQKQSSSLSTLLLQML